MGKEYNLERIGKRMPYSLLPEGFFDQMQANVLSAVEKEELSKAEHRTHRHCARVVRLYLSAAAVAASICLVVVLAKSYLVDNTQHDSSAATVNTIQVDKAYDNLSTEEQEELNATYANDVYLSMQ